MVSNFSSEKSGYAGLFVFGRFKSWELSADVRSLGKFFKRRDYTFKLPSLKTGNFHRGFL
ncbi:MAG: hypothetical protein H6608_06450 [Flavobacteriales bacterium]|nr:hypothetical protein [Bacteroidota bacterium]MCB9240749.1 hypothetical protein [Flavobacteriales bacterium]